MYFVKARKHIEEHDANELPEKSRRDHYQRSDSARLILQAISHQAQVESKLTNVSTFSKTTAATTESRATTVGSAVDLPTNFKLEELPDGAWYRPQKDPKSISGLQFGKKDALLADDELIEHVRSAEYIGTFSVSGSDKAARERQMEAQLEQMRNARERRPVNLIISNRGVKVVLTENNNVFMDHSLKRIWYATCDPEYFQFSFLAREPKTSAEVQYCHAFVTKSAEQAEELISIIGEAFKSTYTESKKQPTFHELIEQQVQQQQAKFREIEKEAKNALQKKLRQIATPTPFSEKVQFRMEQRRKSEDIDLAVGKVWAKQQVELQGVKHIFSPDKTAMASGKKETLIKQSISKPRRYSGRNSMAFQGALMPNPVPSSPPPHPLSALAIKECLETRNSGSKFKGSPVTALKNEIDRRLSMTNGDDIQPSNITEWEFKKEQAKPSKQQANVMANRPLPLPPDFSMSPQRSQQHLGGQNPQQQQVRHLQQQPHALLQQRSLDDYHLPRSSSSQVPLSSNARNDVASVKIRDSPTRRQIRPMSEIATSSSGAAGTTAGGGSSFYEQQRQSLLNNFAASFQLPHHTEGSPVGMYMYGPALQEQERHTDVEQKLHGPQQERGRNFTRRAGGRIGDIRSRGDGDRMVYDPQKSGGVRPFDSSQQHSRQSHIQGHSVKLEQDQKVPTSGSRPSSTSGQGRIEATVPRYQNDSPFQNDKSERGPRHSAGQIRPMSEIATSSSGAAGTTAGGDSSFYQQQRQSLLNNFAASFQLPHHTEGSPVGMYMYGPALQEQERHTDVEQKLHGPQQERGRNFTRRAGGRIGDIRSRGDGDRMVYDPQKSGGVRPFDSSQQHSRQSHIQGHSVKLDQDQKVPTSGSRPSSTSGQGRIGATVPRYQNDSPFQNEK